MALMPVQYPAKDMPAKFPNSRQKVAAGFMHGMLAGYCHQGHDSIRLAADAGLGSDFFLDPLKRITLDQCVRVYELIVEELDDEGFGIFNKPLPRGSMELLFRALCSSADLREAIGRASRYLRILLPEMSVMLAIQQESGCLVIRQRGSFAQGLPEAGRIFAYEWLLRHLHGYFCWLVNRGIALDRVEFPYPPPRHADDYRILYTEDAHFGHEELRAYFKLNLLDLPIRRDEEALKLFLIGAPAKLTSLYRRDREIVIRVRDLLKANMGARHSLQDVADVLFMSARTLHRRLQDEGSSLNAIRSALRRDMAIALMDKGKLTVMEIAAQLGYADTSSFYRAFIGWTGRAPSDYRRRNTDMS